MPHANRVAGALLSLAEATKPKRKRSYYYDIINQKRWLLDGGGKSGNCEECVDNAEAGWVGDDDVFTDSGGFPVDGPPAHPHCECELEYREKRVRVYV